MMVRTKRVNTTFAAKSVSFDHSKTNRTSFGGPKPTEPITVTVTLRADAEAKEVFKPAVKLSRVTLVLYTATPNGHHRLRSQVEIGASDVSDVKFSTDGRTATVKISSKAIFVSEQSPSGDADWVASS